MPIITTKEWLFKRGVDRMDEFCKANNLKIPSVTLVSRGNWDFDCCAYYRPDEGTRMCLPMTAEVATEPIVRNWNWPGNTTDRTPYGVIAHELGHHCDMIASTYRGRYYGNFSIEMRLISGEKPITSYCPNDAEWFAEMFRVFVTNAPLLEAIRPKTYDLLVKRWHKVGGDDWEGNLGGNCPTRIIENIKKKIREGK